MMNDTKNTPHLPTGNPSAQATKGLPTHLTHHIVLLSTKDESAEWFRVDYESAKFLHLLKLS